MARSREFDQDAVLTGAMEAFRRSGFGAVSIKDLESETGLKAGSIYNSFGDKAGLFRAAFDHYLEHVLEDRIAEHAPEDAGLTGLRSLFVSLLHEPGNGSLGCLITNTAVEFGGDTPVPEAATRGLEILSRTFVDRLTAARMPDMSPQATAAAKLLTLYQGILVLIRAGWSKPALEDMINAEFDQIERKIT
jgi:TetR/AcrR family transcriptional regulator, transcriptional repressor for nem operon